MQHALVAHRPPPARSEPHGTFLMLTRVRRALAGATRAVNMYKAWATRAARSAQGFLDTCKRPPECLISRRDGL
eukprot:6467875-Prymnesium_polylepis.1